MAGDDEATLAVTGPSVESVSSSESVIQTVAARAKLTSTLQERAWGSWVFLNPGGRRHRS